MEGARPHDRYTSLSAKAQLTCPTLTSGCASQACRAPRGDFGAAAQQAGQGSLGPDIETSRQHTKVMHEPGGRIVGPSTGGTFTYAQS